MIIYVMSWLSYYRPTHNASQHYSIVGFFDNPDIMSWVCQIMLDYYGIGTNPLYDDRAAAILLSIIKGYHIIGQLIMQYNTTQRYSIIGFFDNPDMMSWVCHNDVGLLRNWHQPSHDDRAAAILYDIINKIPDSRILTCVAGQAAVSELDTILSSTVYKISDFRRLTMDCKPSCCLWTGYNMAKIL